MNKTKTSRGDPLGTAFRPRAKDKNIIFYGSTIISAAAVLLLAALVVVAAVSFGSPDLYHTPWPHSEPHVMVADVNNDGHLDLVNVSGYTGGSVNLGDGTGSFGPMIGFNSPMLYGSTGTLADFDGDGRLDLASTHVSHAYAAALRGLAIYHGYGDGTFSLKQTILFDGTFPGVPIGVGYGVASGDFDRDGNADLAIALNDVNTEAGALLLLHGNGDGTFNSWYTIPTTTIMSQALLTADFNHDGLLDLAMTGGQTNDVLIFLGDGTGVFALVATLPAGDYPAGMVTADVNADGNPDLVIADGHEPEMHALLGSGNGVDWTDVTSVTESYTPLAIADFNGDGKLDVALGNYYSNRVDVLLGNGAGSFGPPQAIGNFGTPNGIAAGDFNGDGRPDIAVSSRYEELIGVYLNTSTPVGDTTPPVITASDVTAPATSGSGAFVSYTATANDNIDGSVSVACLPASGSLFPIGNTTVNCQAADSGGNIANHSFSVYVKNAEEQLSELGSYVIAIGPGTSLTAKVTAAQTASAAGKKGAACGALRALINEAKAQAGKKLTAEQAETLFTTATRISQIFGC